MTIGETVTMVAAVGFILGWVVGHVSSMREQVREIRNRKY